LTQKWQYNMNVKLVTLKTNHTLIGRVDCVDDNTIIIKEPVQVFMQPSKDGMQMGFGPFLDYAQEHKTGIKISMIDVFCITTPIIELENQYNQIFGSGITIANAIPKL
jgi:hypothetical protein